MSELEVLPARPLDEKLLGMADSYSPDEISRRLKGVVSAKAVAARIVELLGSRDWLTAAQQDQLVTLKMRRILSKLEEKFEDFENLGLQLKVLKEIGNRLDKRQAATTIDLNTYSQNVGRQMGRVVDNALSYMKGALRDEIDADRWDELVKEALEHARHEIAKNEVED